MPHSHHRHVHLFFPCRKLLHPQYFPSSAIHYRQTKSPPPTTHHPPVHASFPTQITYRPTVPNPQAKTITNKGKYVPRRPSRSDRAIIHKHNLPRVQLPRPIKKYARLPFCFVFPCQSTSRHHIQSQSSYDRHRPAHPIDTSIFTSPQVPRSILQYQPYCFSAVPLPAAHRSVPIPHLLSSV